MGHCLPLGDFRFQTTCIPPGLLSLPLLLPAKLPPAAPLSTPLSSLLSAPPNDVIKDDCLLVLICLRGLLALADACTTPCPTPC